MEVVEVVEVEEVEVVEVEVVEVERQPCQLVRNTYVAGYADFL